jgi:hypothetical protein
MVASLHTHTHTYTHTHLGVERGGNGAHGDVIMCRAYPARRDHQVTRAALPPNLLGYFRGVVSNLYIYIYVTNALFSPIHIYIYIYIYKAEFPPILVAFSRTYIYTDTQALLSRQCVQRKDTM